MAAETPWTPDRVEKYLSELPSGYRFRPTDGELVVDYLRKKILDQTMPPNRIRTFNIYDSRPIELYQMYRVTARENACYFFTTRKKKYPNGIRTARTAGKGFWKSTTGDMAVLVGDTTVGWKRSLVYHQRTAQENVKTDWMMQEYTLNPNSLTADTTNGVADDYALVKIYHKNMMKSNSFVMEPQDLLHDHNPADQLLPPNTPIKHGVAAADQQDHKTLLRDPSTTAHETHVNDHATNDQHHPDQDDKSNDGKSLIQQEEKEPILLNNANDLHYPQHDSGNYDGTKSLKMIWHEQQPLLPSVAAATTTTTTAHEARVEDHGQDCPNQDGSGNDGMNLIQQEKKVPILSKTTNDPHHPLDDSGNDGTTTLNMILQEQQPLFSSAATASTTTITTTHEARVEDHDQHKGSNNNEVSMKMTVEQSDDVGHMLLSNFTYDQDLQSHQEKVELPPFPPSLIILDDYSYPLQYVNGIWSLPYIHPERMVLPHVFAYDASYYYHGLDNNIKRQKFV